MGAHLDDCSQRGSLSMNHQRCKRIDNLPHVIPGWGCCKCHVYNSYGRKVCKSCGHVPCYPPPEETADGKR